MSLTSSIGKTVSFISGPFIVFCPLCHWGPILLTAGQGTFFLAFAKILGPLILIMLLISTLSFYFTYRKVHHNRLPLVLAIMGSSGIIYINYINNLANPLFLIFGLLFMTIAAGIDFNLRFSAKGVAQRGCDIPTRKS